MHSMLSSPPALAQNTIAERVFKALDDNHDGLVELKDIRQLFRDPELIEVCLEHSCFAQSVSID